MTSMGDQPGVATASATSSRLAALTRTVSLGLAFTATLAFLALPIGVGYLAYQRWIAGHSLQAASLHLEDALLFLEAAGSLLGLGAALAWVTVFLRRIDRQGDLLAVGWTRVPRGWSGFGIAFGGGVLVAAIPVVIALGLQQLRFGASHASLEGSGDVILDMVGSIVILAGLIAAEELVFRGYMPWTLRRSGWSEAVAALVPALLFATYRIVFAPGSWVAFSNALAAGVLLGLLARRTGSLHVVIGARLGWALFSGTIFSLPVSGVPVEGLLHALPTPGLVLDHAYGPEGSWLTLVMLVVGVGLAQGAILRQRQTQVPG